MIPIWFVAILVLLVIGLAPGIGLFGKRGGAQFDQQCRDRGWLVEEKGGSGFDWRVSGVTNGVHWEYVAIHYVTAMSPGGTQLMHHTRWATADVSLPAGDMVMITPAGRRGDQITPVFQAMDKLGGLAEKLGRMVMINWLGGDAQDADEFMRMRPILAGSDTLRKTFTVVATSEGAASKLLRQGEPALMQWAANPAFKGAWQTEGIFAWGKGLAIPAEKMVPDINTMEAVVNLGTSLANAIKGG